MQRQVLAQIRPDGEGHDGWRGRQPQDFPLFFGKIGYIAPQPTAKTPTLRQRQPWQVFAKSLRLSLLCTCVQRVRTGKACNTLGWHTEEHHT